MAWLYVPGLTPSDSGSDSSESIELCVTSSGKPTWRRLSWPAWKRRKWIQRLSGTISQPSRARLGVERWISSLRGFRASRSRSPGSSKAPTTPVGCGPTWSDYLGKFDRAGLFLRTSPDLFDSDSSMSSPDLPGSGTMRSGVVGVRKPLAAPIEGYGSSCSPGEGTSWATPTADDMKNRAATYAQGGLPLPAQARRAFWPTPVARDENTQKTPEQIEAARAKGHGVSNLNETASLWPTPAARDEKGTNSPEHLKNGTGRLHLDQLPNFVRHSWPTPTAADATGAESRNVEGSKANAGTSLVDAVIWGDSSGRRDGATLHPLTSSVCGPECSPEHRRLNPLFVEWLMGLPTGWSAAGNGSGPSEIQLTRWRRRMRSVLWQLAVAGWRSS